MPTDPSTPPLTSFSTFIADHSDDLDDQLTAELRDLIGSVAASQKKGKLVPTIDVDTTGKSGRMIRTQASVKVTPPKPDPSESMYWVTADGGLSRTDPFQQRLPLEDAPPAPSASPVVPAPEMPPAGVDPETGEIAG